MLPSPSPNALAGTGRWTHRRHSPARSRRDTSSRSRSAGGSVRGFGGRAMARSSRQPSASETLCQRRAPRSPRSSPRGSAIRAPPTPPPALSPAQRRHSPTRVLGAALQLRSSDAPQRRFYSRQRAAGVGASEVRCPGVRVQEGALPEPAHLRATAHFP